MKSVDFPDAWDVLVGEGVEFKGPLKFNERGRGNRLYIGKGCFLGNVRFDMLGNNNNIIIEDDVYIKKAHFRHRGNDQVIKVGGSTRINGVYFLCESGCSIETGEGCLFSYDISLRTTDAHHILDLETGEKLNEPKSITIGNHVWVGTEVVVTKGVTIADDVVVGQRALVNKSVLESHVIVAGAPGQIVRRGVTWKR
ncbi:acyltransferase [Stutzerimonas kunmingensis]|uniref:acyltransferase n=1 Tax=Stutzerimonas kunmingensis TaxID=1211807 RepID=UPI0037CFE025